MSFRAQFGFRLCVLALLTGNGDGHAYGTAYGVIQQLRKAIMWHFQNTERKIMHFQLDSEVSFPLLCFISLSISLMK